MQTGIQAAPSSQMIAPLRRSRRVDLGLLCALLFPPMAVAGTPETTIWFDQPASHFTESCPLGGGRLGAMLFGGVEHERIVLNENSLWSGSRQEADREGAAQALPEIRRLLLAGKNAEAQRLVDHNFTCKPPGSGDGQGASVAFGCYQTLGNLRLKFFFVSPDPSEDYRRELDLTEAVARVTFRQGGIAFTRELLVSASDDVIALRLTADAPNAIHFDAQLDRPERFQTAADGAEGLLMTGALADGRGGSGLKYAARLRVLNRGGTVAVNGNTLRVRDASEVLLLVAAATDYRGFAGRNLTDPVAATAKDLRRAARRSFAALRKSHVADYQRFFNRVELQLGTTPAGLASQLTPARLAAVRRGSDDPALAALLFNFGRYLLISSSRPGGLPANLQGLWAEEIQTPWNGDWHLNVNVQMNYWPAEVCNLAELHEPLFALVASLAVPGTRTARAYYGARGWVAHVITNPWGFTSPGERASWGATTTGSAWLCQHLWDHYLFMRDRKFLRQFYPILKGSAQFYSDMLIEEPNHQWLVTAPSNSPENAFRLPDGQVSHICLGATMDLQLIRHLFTACIEAARELDVDADFREELSGKRDRLAPTRISSDGRIMEWLEEYPEPEPTHRHISHLWGLYPGNEISMEQTPELGDAARRSLEVRGDKSTGWATAYRMAAWARLRDGDRFHRLLRALLADCTLPNLFGTHPPFQIDGNFGAAAAIAEVFLQSQASVLELLPALPAAWPEGKVSGLRARGGFQVDLQWRNGRLFAASIHSDLGQPCLVSYGGQRVRLQPGRGKSITLDGDLKSGKPSR